MKDTSTTIVSHEVAKKAYDNWKQEYDRCLIIYEEADALARSTMITKKGWFRTYNKSVFLTLWDTGSWYYNYGELLCEYGILSSYTKDVCNVCQEEGYDSFHTNVKQLLSSGNDIQASVEVIGFINKWKDFE